MTAAPQLQTAVAQVDELLAQLADKQRELEADRLKVSELIADTEAAMGEAYLTGDQSGPRLLAELRARAEGIAAAIRTLDKRKAVLQLDRRKAQVVDLQRQVETMEAELAAIEAACRPHLAALAEIEQIEGGYSHHVLYAQRRGQWTYNLEQIRVHGAENLPPDACRHDVGGGYARARSSLLRKAIHDIKTEIQQIEQTFAPPAEAPRPASPDYMKVYQPGYRDRHTPPPEPEVPTLTQRYDGTLVGNAAWRDAEAREQQQEIARRGAIADAIEKRDAETAKRIAERQKKQPAQPAGGEPQQ